MYRVLIVEDIESIRTLLGKLLEEMLLCRVHSVADRAEARAMLECYVYAAVIVDLSFTRGRLEGLDILEDLGTRSNRPRLIAYSEDKTHEQMARQKGADVFLLSPFPDSLIVETVRQMIEAQEQQTPRELIPGASGRIEEFLSPGGTQTFLQPIFELKGKDVELKSVEFLTRGPSGSVFERADVLFTYARKSRVEIVLDKHCIQKALEKAVLLPDTIDFSVNIHPSTLASTPDFSSWFLGLAAVYGLSPQRIYIEILEQSPAWSRDNLLHNISQLRGAGVRIALDDVGIGNSNYQMMVEIHPDHLKLDRYFVHGCSSQPSRKAIVASVTQLASDFGATIVAEGVESQEDLDVLRSFGIHLVQSYMFCPPMPAEHLLVAPTGSECRPCSLSRERNSVTAPCALKGLGLCLVDAGKSKISL